MGGKAVTEGMSRGAFAQFRLSDRFLDRSLHMSFMDMVSFFLTRVFYGGQRKSGKNPLPDILFCGVLILFIQLADQECAGKIGFHILLM